MSVWNKELFASLGKYLQACRQLLNEPHATSLKESKIQAKVESCLMLSIDNSATSMK